MCHLFTGSSKRFVTIAVIFVMSGKLSVDSISAVFPAETKKHHKHPVFDSQNLNVLMPNCEVFKGKYCLQVLNPFIEVAQYGKFFNNFSDPLYVNLLLISMKRRSLT